MLKATPATHHAAPVVHAEVEATPATKVHAAAKAAGTTPTHVAGKGVKVKGKPDDITAADIPGGGGVVPDVTYSPVPGAYNPTQLETAYGANLLGLANQGQGVTIGVVVQDDDPNITADADAYSARYNLPLFDGLDGDPGLSVYQDTRLGPVAPAEGTGKALETSLDVEMAPRPTSSWSRCPPPRTTTTSTRCWRSSTAPSTRRAWASTGPRSWSSRPAMATKKRPSRRT